MYQMGPIEIRVIIDHLQVAEKIAAKLDLPKHGGQNDIEWRVGQAMKYILNASLSPIQIEQQTCVAAANNISAAIRKGVIEP